MDLNQVDTLRRGVRAVTGLDMPVFPKRRFQHGAVPVGTLRASLGGDEAGYRRAFHALYS
jgi:asparagine synthase (glutamine-hydrolysing)